LNTQDQKDIIYACVALCQETSSKFFRDAESATDIEKVRELYGAAKGALRCAELLMRAAHEVK